MGSQSNLADVIRLLDRCSTDELRMVQAMLSVKLGSSTAGSRQRSDTGKQVAARSPRRGRGGAGRESSTGKAGPKGKKGNPQRKSQYETHPLYRSYKAAKVAVEQQAKTDKVRFHEVKGDLMDRYEQAFSHWLEAKHSFRRFTGDETTANQARSQGDQETADDSNPVGRPQEGPGSMVLDSTQENLGQGEEAKSGRSEASSSSEDKVVFRPPGNLFKESVLGKRERAAPRGQQVVDMDDGSEPSVSETRKSVDKRKSGRKASS